MLTPEDIGVVGTLFGEGIAVSVTWCQDLVGEAETPSRRVDVISLALTGDDETAVCLTAEQSFELMTALAAGLDALEAAKR